MRPANAGRTVATMEHRRVSGAQVAIGFLREHPAVAGAVLYFYTSAVGAVYQWVYFRSFGVTILDFAEPEDFLLAAFRQPQAVLLLCGFLLLYGLVMLSKAAIEGAAEMTGRRAAHDSGAAANIAAGVTRMLVDPPFLQSGPGRWIGRTAFALLFVAYSVVPVGLVAAVDAREAKTAPASAEVQLDGGPRLTGLVFVGKTGSYAFFYHPATRTTRAIPAAEIITIQVPAPEAD